MARKQYSLDEVLKSLSRKSGCRVLTNGTIEVLKDQTDLGNGSWGKIDFLCKRYGFIYYLVKRFS